MFSMINQIIEELDLIDVIVRVAIGNIENDS